jgi:hypothetical protein
MTEKQWLRSVNAETMNSYYAHRHTERKARLLMLACCLRHSRYMVEEPVLKMTELLTTHYADPRKPDEPFDGKAIRAAYRKLEGYASSTDSGPIRGLAFGMVAAAEPVATMKRLHEDFEYLVFSCLHDVAAGVTEGKVKRESRVQAQILRDILGNPFRPVVVEPEWLTDTVVSLARQMYVTQDFTAMPILADALQEAGCENADILGHCRDEKQQHVRGCWVLDLIIGNTVERGPDPAPAARRKPSPRRKTRT